MAVLLTQSMFERFDSLTNPYAFGMAGVAAGFGKNSL
jgi:hypothetical protein